MLKRISRKEYECLISGAEVLLTDDSGPKVLQLPDDSIVKLFRRKHFFSSQLWMTYASRFAYNAKMLPKKGIPTVEMNSTFLVPEIERQAVHYKLLVGDTLRDWLEGKEDPERLPMMDKLGAFVAHIHKKGILFRSLHLNNILVLPDGELGLIDISDMGFRWFGALSRKQRLRNFHHMDRYDPDRLALRGDPGRRFRDSYFEHAKLDKKSEQEISELLDTIFIKREMPQE